MSVIYSAFHAAGDPPLCDLLGKAIETEEAAKKASDLAMAGEAIPNLNQILAARGTASQALSNAVAAADAATPARCTHALVIGVGEYPHLAGGALFADQPAVMAMGLAQLTCSVQAAQAVTDWLLTSFQNQERPLATIELLLSPGIYSPSDTAATVLGIAPGSSVRVEAATFGNIQAAFGRWLARCNHDRQANVAGDMLGDSAFFFFSGHGLEKEVSLVLPSDFGADPNIPFANAVDLTTTHRLMGQCKADLQCWVIDACRESPIELLTSQEKPGRALKGDTGDPFLLRDAPLYQAAAEGKQAFGPPNKPTYFTQQLIKCLDGIGADRKVGGKWRVTSQSLRAGLNAAIDRLPPVNGKRVTCDTGNGKSNFTRTLHFASDPIHVLAKVFCNPFDVQPLADLYLMDTGNNKTPRAAREASLWVIEVAAGAYRPGADFDAGVRNPFIGEQTLLMPPDNPLELTLP